MVYSVVTFCLYYKHAYLFTGVFIAHRSIQQILTKVECVKFKNNKLSISTKLSSGQTIGP